MAAYCSAWNSRVNAPWNSHACERDVVTEHLAREQQRYLTLINQLRAEWIAEKGTARGFELQTAPKLGTTAATLNRLKAGTRDPGMEVIRGAVEVFRIDRTFFYGTFSEEPHYSKFRGVRAVPETGPPPALQAFLTAGAMGMEVTDDERTWLLQQSWPGEPTPETYYLLLKALRTLRFEASESSYVRSTPKRARRKR
jgi:hypothetical protein